MRPIDTVEVEPLLYRKANAGGQYHLDQFNWFERCRWRWVKRKNPLLDRNPPTNVRRVIQTDLERMEIRKRIAPEVNLVGFLGDENGGVEMLSIGTQHIARVQSRKICRDKWTFRPIQQPCRQPMVLGKGEQALAIPGYTPTTKKNEPQPTIAQVENFILANKWAQERYVAGSTKLPQGKPFSDAVALSLEVSEPKPADPPKPRSKPAQSPAAEGF